MANTALIPVFTGTLADTTVQLCDARTLHAFMQVLRDFSDWIKGRIRKYGFVEGVDYLLTKSGEQVYAKSGENFDSPNLGNQKRGGDRRSIEYHLTLDMAKELSMVENNDMGRQARRYFIECEKAAANAMALPNFITPAQRQHLRELVQIVVDSGKQSHGETWNRLHRKMKVNSYLELTPDKFNAACAYLQAKMDDTSMAALVQKHFPEATKRLSAPPAWVQVSIDWDFVTSRVNAGQCTGAHLLNLAVASTNTLFANTCNQPKAWGDDIARQITVTTPYADVQAIAIRSSMELMLRCSGEQTNQEKLVA